MNHEVLGAMLNLKGYTCDMANSGEQALKLIHSRLKVLNEKHVPMYQLIICDYSMP